MAAMRLTARLLRSQNSGWATRHSTKNARLALPASPADPFGRPTMSGGFAVVLIVGIGLFATGMGGNFALLAMGVGAVGMTVSAFAPKRRRG